jgi:hypothetical protein
VKLDNAVFGFDTVIRRYRNVLSHGS